MQILVGVNGPIGRLSFNRADARNAISKAMWQSLPKTINQMVERGARVIVITGENGVFAAGADIAELRAVNDMAEAEALSTAIADGIEAVAMARAATIAMIDGPCLGGGCLIAAACDLRYATQASTFAVPVARLGIVLDQTNIRRLCGLLGPAWAKEMLYVGATIDSITAQNIGLLNDYFATASEMKAAVAERASVLAANSLDSILATKSTIASLYSASNDLPEALRGPSAREVAMSYFSPDLKARLAKLTAGS